MFDSDSISKVMIAARIMVDGNNSADLPTRNYLMEAITKEFDKAYMAGAQSTIDILFPVNVDERNKEHPLRQAALDTLLLKGEE